MSKNPHRLQKSNFQNYLTLNNGCKVHFTGDTRPLPHLNPQNILTDNIRQVWLSNEIPATCIIDMRNLEDRPVFFNRIGFLCWHQYQSNPKVIQVQYCRKEDIQNPNNWTIWSKFKLQLLGQWQHFKLPSTMSKNILFLKITILQNHSQKNNQQEDDEQVQKTFDNSTYLNQVSLGFIEQIAESRVQALHTQGNMRQKTFSDFRKSNPSQKQIKKLNDKVKHLSVENEVMKKTIEHQGDIIIKLQEAVEKLTETVSKLQRIQSTQQQKLTLISTKANNRSSHKHQNHKPLLQQYLNSQSQIHNSIESKNNSRQRSNRQNSIYDESNPNSIYQSKKSKSLRNPNSTANKPSTNSKKRNVINANQIQDSQNDLSQYEGDTIDQRAYNIDRKVRQDNRRSQDDTTTKEKTYIPMLQKLQELIILRDKKKHKLRQQTKPYKRNDHIRQGSSSDPQQQEY